MAGPFQNEVACAALFEHAACLPRSLSRGTKSVVLCVAEGDLDVYRAVRPHCGAVILIIKMRYRYKAMYVSLLIVIWWELIVYDFIGMASRPLLWPGAPRRTFVSQCANKTRGSRTVSLPICDIADVYAKHTLG
jgi:hypothetical protein